VKGKSLEKIGMIGEMNNVGKELLMLKMISMPGVSRPLTY
jgi:hypothetical protein